MKIIKQYLIKTKIVILTVVVLIGIGIGYYQWRGDFIKYYSQNTGLEAQLFPNVANTHIDTERQKNWFSQVPYENVTIDIGSLASKYDNSEEANKANNIFDRTSLEDSFDKWLIQAFDIKQAKKVSDHMIIKYDGHTIKEISY